MGSSVLCCWWDNQLITLTDCESIVLSSPQPVVVASDKTETIVVVKDDEPADGWKGFRRKIQKTFRLCRRFVKLVVALAPVAALYPLQRLLGPKPRNEDQHYAGGFLADVDTNQVDGPLGWYLRLCLYCVEWSGAAVVKLMQWASSRPDLLGHEFCAVFSRLQDDTTPHSWKHTEQALRTAYGDDWKDKIQLGNIIGSGCIGQVYDGVVTDSEGKEQRVAVKVLHPNVEEDIDCDLELLRLVSYYLNKSNAIKGFKYLNVEGAIDEFSSLLKLQLDLRTEGANLIRFNENFADVDQVTFPQLVEGYNPTRNVLVMTFCEGIPVSEFIRENRDDPELLRRMCLLGIRSICKMIFEDNFLHGDLHPGNVLVSQDDEHKFMVLDVGMVTEYSDEDHRLIVDVLTSFIRRDGRRAGELLIADTNTRNTDDQALAQEQYIEKIEALTAKAHGKDFFMEKLGTYITYICDAAATHHVMMNQAFVSAALAIKIQEGLALSLDPDVSIVDVANPIILQCELKRRLWDVAHAFTESILGMTNGVAQRSGLSESSSAPPTTATETDPS